jgi:hypothetical protein
MKEKRPLTLERVMELEPVRIKNESVTVAVRLTGEFAETWKDLRAVLDMTPTELVRECIRLRAFALCAQIKEYRCVAELPNEGEVNVIDYLKLAEPRKA